MDKMWGKNTPCTTYVTNSKQASPPRATMHDPDWLTAISSCVL